MEKTYTIKADQVSAVFSELMNKYEEENESIIYELGLFLMRISQFIMTAFLVFTVIQ
jgi:large-conductance mechanosensitive channel